MENKKCFKCGRVMPIDSFYRHPQMTDGHLNKCKECTKSDITKNREDKIEYYKEYDRNRADLPRRVEARRLYAEQAKTDPERKAKKAISMDKYKNKYPEKYKAHYKMRDNMRDKKIEKPELCSVCGKKKNLEGHHHDYSKPLDVLWVCRKCHIRIHKDLRELERQSNT